MGKVPKVTASHPIWNISFVTIHLDGQFTTNPRSRHERGSRLTSSKKNRDRHAGLPRSAGLGLPPGGVGKPLEMCGGDEGRRQVYGILDDRGHHEPGVAIWLGEEVVVLLERGLVAVRHAVLAQVSR